MIISIEKKPDCTMQFKKRFKEGQNSVYTNSNPQQIIELMEEYNLHTYTILNPDEYVKEQINQAFLEKGWKFSIEEDKKSKTLSFILKVEHNE